VPPQTAAVLSRLPNRTAGRSHWVVWTEGGALKFLHHDPEQGPSPLKSAALPAADAALIGPAHHDVPKDREPRPGGAALLYSPTTRALHAFRLSTDGAAPLGTTPLAGPAPSWATSVVRSDGKKTVVVVQSSGKGVSLSELPWPGSEGTPAKLAELPGVFAAAGATLGLMDDVLAGALLLRTEAARGLERVDFEAGPAGAFQAQPPAAVPDDVQDPAETFLVRVSGRKAMAALFKSRQGLWSLYDGAGVQPLPEPLRRTPYPLDLAFHGDTKPVLLIGGREAGFRIARPDGSPVPKPAR
jgi:hypothetical protein